MPATIELTDIRLDYVSIAEARTLPGLRLVLGAYAIPGPWREACKGMFYVKDISYTPVVTADTRAADLQFGMEDTVRELREWTSQASAPVAVWNDERPRVRWIAQLMAAIIGNIGRQLASQTEQGRRFLIGDRLSALDIYWSTFAGLFDPLPPEQCPMGTAFRDFYRNPHTETQEVLSTELLQHRDFIYREYLELPIVF